MRNSNRNRNCVFAGIVIIPIVFNTYVLVAVAAALILVYVIRSYVRGATRVGS